MSTELVAQDMGMPTGVTLRDPQRILDEAKERCTVLTKMVEETESYMVIGKKRHLLVEAWITLAQFYGCSGRIVRTEDIEIGGVMGFKAYAEVTHDQTGTRLSSAESICMKDEPNWDTRPKYKWTDGVREQVGEETVPLHQVMSMAQTRALAKALAAKFRWVVVLGGWSPTPADEMTGTEGSHQAEPQRKGRPEPSKKERGGMRLPFGRSKGKALDDESVPLDDLNWMLDYVTKNVGNDKRKAYEKQDREMMTLLTNEIEKRNAAGGTTASHPMSDDEWTDFCALSFSTNEEQYTQASLDFKCADPSVLAPDKRVAFQKHLNGLVSIALGK